MRSGPCDRGSIGPCPEVEDLPAPGRSRRPPGSRDGGPHGGPRLAAPSRAAHSAEGEARTPVRHVSGEASRAVRARPPAPAPEEAR
jgi:hypothetical protein